MKITKLFFLLSSTLISCQHPRDHPFGCHMQSPVNIQTSKTKAGIAHRVVLHYGTSKERVANTGHSIQLNYDSGSYLIFDDQRYDFKQLHFHTPAEHQLDNEQLSMEMHLVHTHPVAGRKDPDFLVIATFFKEGASNDFLSSFLNMIPDSPHTERSIANRTIDASAMIPQTLHDFYHYKGSLTTPPYSETVDWIILKDIKSATQRQIDRMHSMEGDNARKVQALYNRTIEIIK